MHAGTWYAGVEGDDHTDCTYTITINKFDCPMNCSGRGTCIHAQNGSRVCECDEVPTHDCNLYMLLLVYVYWHACHLQRTDRSVLQFAACTKQAEIRIPKLQQIELRMHS